MTVYVIQKPPLVRDQNQGERKPKFDLSPAKEFGELVYMLSPIAQTTVQHNSQEVIQELHGFLSGYGPGDYLLLSGNPILIGLVVAIAADYNEGAVSLLQWSGSAGQYIPVTIEGIFEDSG